MPKKKNIDSIDIKIINLLSANANISNKALSDKIGLATMPTLNRVNKLKKKGYLKGSSTEVDLAKFGYSLIAFQIIEIQKGFSEQFKSLVLSLRNVTKFQELGQLGFSIENKEKFGLTLHARSSDDLVDFMNTNYKNLPYVESVNTHILKDNIKDNKSIELNPDIDTLE